MRSHTTMTRTIWTPQDIDALIQHYPHMSTQDLSHTLGKPTRSIYNKAHRLGLHKSPQYLQQMLQSSCNKLKESGKAHRFSPGHTPLNKGKKTPQHIKAKMAHTWFSKGNKPHNTKYDGHERIDTKEGYILIRIDGKYVLKHRQVYIQHYGPIPRGHCIVFRDRNKLNLDPNNLECITRRENMLRNSIQNYPQDIVSCIKLVSKIKKHIHNAKEQN